MSDKYIHDSNNYTLKFFGLNNIFFHNKFTNIYIIIKIIINITLIILFFNNILSFFML